MLECSFCNHYETKIIPSFGYVVLLNHHKRKKRTKTNLKQISKRVPLYSFNDGNRLKILQGGRIS